MQETHASRLTRLPVLALGSPGHVPQLAAQSYTSSQVNIENKNQPRTSVLL